MLSIALVCATALTAVSAAGSAVRMSGGKAPAVCQRFAAPSGNDGNPGSSRAPFATAWKLAQTLRPGETGCITGRLRGYVRFARAGTATAPITLRPAPGASATLCGQFDFAATASYWRVSGLHFDGSCATGDTVAIMGNHVTFANNEVTNHFRGLSCLVIGSHLRGPRLAYGVVVRNNRIHDCGIGGPMSTHQHAIYAAAPRSARITDNYIYRNTGISVQLYPDAQHTLVARNIIDASATSSGLVVAGEGPYASSYNLVKHNIITRNPGYGVFGSWGGPVGSANQIEANCFWENVKGDLPSDPDGLVGRRNINADPKFVTTTPGEYRLRARSPCTRMHPRGRVGPPT